MAKEKEPVTIEKVRKASIEKKQEIRARLAEFEAIWQAGNDEKLWEEMVFCFFTGGCSAKMGIRAVEASRHLLKSGTYDELWQSLSGVHRYPFARSRYIIASREFLKADCGMRLRDRLSGFPDNTSRRNWLAREKGIKGLGFKEASHYLRNIGFKGYAILDKHVLRCMAEMGIIESPAPPNTGAKYLEAEEKLRKFSKDEEIDFDELDLVLWSLKTGEILK